MLVLSDGCSNTLAVVLYDVLYVFNNWLSALTLKKITSQVFSKVALHWYGGEFSKHSLHCFVMPLNTWLAYWKPCIMGRELSMVWNAFEM